MCIVFSVNKRCVILGTTCKACKKGPQLKSNIMGFCFTCAKIWSSADSQASSLSGIRTDMQRYGIPLHFANQNVRYK